MKNIKNSVLKKTWKEKLLNITTKKQPLNNIKNDPV
jgi:hypothetical protein